MATAAAIAAALFAADTVFCATRGGAVAAVLCIPVADTAAFGTAEPIIEARLAGLKARNGSIPSPAGVAVRPG